MKIEEVEKKMNDRIDFYEESLSEIRAGRANPAILNRVMVEYYGTPTPINQVSSVSVPEARQILIQPWDMSILKAIERAIIEANLGINPQNDGKCIRLIFPELTEERRKDIVKEIKELTENTKVLIRNIRREAIDSIKKEEKIARCERYIRETKRGERRKWLIFLIPMFMTVLSIVVSIIGLIALIKVLSKVGY